MTRFLLLLMLCAQTIITKAQQDGAIFLIRHAEVTYVEGNRNPELNEEGEKRAEMWAHYFSDIEFHAIFSTDLIRTRSTASATADKKGVKVQFYDPFSKDAIKAFQEAAKHGNVLVVGHSNTVPAQTNALVGKEQFQQLGEKDYDNVFMVINPNGQTKAFVFKVN